jgi:hypothetical protein
VAAPAAAPALAKTMTIIVNQIHVIDGNSSRVMRSADMANPQHIQRLTADGKAWRCIIGVFVPTFVTCNKKCRIFV